MFLFRIQITLTLISQSYMGTYFTSWVSVIPLNLLFSPTLYGHMCESKTWLIINCVI